jgi:hypothetical protein
MMSPDGVKGRGDSSVEKFVEKYGAMWNKMEINSYLCDQA